MVGISSPKENVAQNVLLIISTATTKNQARNHRSNN